MKAAKPPSAADGPSSLHRRSQPVRQTRTNPPRTTAGLNRTNSTSLAGGPAHEQQIDIFPAVTHFADAITALPKELVRHFTLLKEVDAKIFAPEEALFQLIDAALKAPGPEASTRPPNDASSSVAHASTPMSGQNSSSGVALSTRAQPGDDAAAANAPQYDAGLHRRHLFRQTAFKIQEMLVSLEEKNHVISTANDALQKQLARIEDVWPHLEAEFSDEAKWGSTTHWAYAANRNGRAGNAQAERSRREGAATLSAAAQQLADEAAARSETRKQAVAAKKISRNQHAQESDLEPRAAEPHKKGQGTSKPKGQKAAADSPAAVGLGISTPVAANGNPDKKRRKVEKPANGAALSAERAMSTVFGAGAAKPKTASPRETPAPDGTTKKRKALPTSGSQAKKSRTGAAGSPSLASSPIVGTFPDPAKIARSSPAPPNAARPASSRARQNSTHSNLENGRPRASSTASNKPNGVVSSLGAADTPTPSNGSRPPTTDAKAQKDGTATPKLDGAAAKAETEASGPQQQTVRTVNGGKKEVPSKGTEEPEAKKEAAATPVIPPPPPPTIVTVTTKSGRASKPSTPALSTFAEAAATKPRPSRAGEGGGGSAAAASVVGSAAAGGGAIVKRSHKKGASQTAAAMQAIVAQATAADSAVAATTATAKKEGGGARRGGDDDDDVEIDGDEPRYCYCNQVSYGEMVACDAEGCVREWFHLGCVGLKVAPKGNAKWYCDDCIKRLKLAPKKINGR